MILKAELKRKGRGYRELAERLTAMGTPETDRNIANKISRGGFTAAFLPAMSEARLAVETVRLENLGLHGDCLAGPVGTERYAEQSSAWAARTPTQTPGRPTQSMRANAGQRRPISSRLLQAALESAPSDGRRSTSTASSGVSAQGGGPQEHSHLAYSRGCCLCARTASCGFEH